MSIINGQLFTIFKYLSEADNGACPRDRCTSRSIVKQTVATGPFPNNLIFNLTWKESDLKPTNTIKVLATLCSFGYMQNMFQLDQSTNKQDMKCHYRLHGLLCFSGAHYLAFLKVKSQLSPTEMKWHMFNDQKVQLFDDLM